MLKMLSIGWGFLPSASAKELRSAGAAIPEALNGYSTSSAALTGTYVHRSLLLTRGRRLIWFQKS